MSEPRDFRPQMYWADYKTKLENNSEADEYPETSHAIRALIMEDMKENGFDSHFPIILDHIGKIVAGRCRYGCAVELKLEFPFSKLSAGTDIESFCTREQDNRKHLTEQFLEKRRRERIDRIAELKESGKTTREIAEEEGVSQAQVMRDITKKQESLNPPGSNENSETDPVNDAAGGIGKKTSRKKRGKKGTSKASSKTPEKEKEKEPEILMDEVEFPIPPGLVSVFEKAKTFHEIVNQLNAINRTLKELSEHAAGACMRLQGAQVDLKNLKETVRFDTPYAVCPACKGIAKTRKANCPCNNRGWLIEGAYKNLPSELRN